MAQNSGELTSAQVEVFELFDSSSDYVLEIHAVNASGVPINTGLASATIPDPEASGRLTITGNFANPATVEAGQQYALVVKRPGSNNLGIRLGDDCPGREYFSNSETGSFLEASGLDLVFATFVTDNEPPLAGDDSYGVNQDQTLTMPTPGVLANDKDPQNDPLTAVKVGDPSHGTLTLNPDGSFTYAPNKGFSGTDSFTYKANDGTNDSSPATVTITVKPVNGPPQPPSKGKHHHKHHKGHHKHNGGRGA